MSNDKSIEELERIADWATRELDKPPKKKESFKPKPSKRYSYKKPIKKIVSNTILGLVIGLEVFY